jgi:recombination protein RecA
MAATRKEKLDQVIGAIQKRWGAQAIGRSAEQVARETPHIATGYRPLDEATGAGGIPRGRISELLGVPTSGMTTVALKIVAQAQAGNGAAVYIDFDRNFDPSYALRSGVLLEQLVLIHPFNAVQALDMLPDFVRNEGFDLLVCDLPVRVQSEANTGRKLASTVGRLLAPLHKSNSTLLFLTTLAGPGGKDGPVYPQQATLPHFATLRLLFQRERWLYRQRDVHGFETKVTVIKNKLSPPGQEARITVFFDEGAPEERL